MKTLNGGMDPEDPYNQYNNWKKGNGRPHPNPYERSPLEPSPHDPWPKHPDWKIPEKPRVITISDLFPRIDRWGIGYLPLLEQLKSIANEKPSYPPYDIIDRKDDTTVVSVAVAGFTKKELEVSIHEGVLKIEGKKKAKKETGEVVYQGIAARDFTLTFALAEYFEVKSASVEDGMLTIVLFKNVPDEKKPKIIEIG
ncbi:IbpA Molecular chaperone (small heat shock protein) [uncultured Caudovirales phage]|uniref:IbpA Molecular chaperone (Small heat shock protein) n=1 Tax=uncultured Caudovirales phage TaxID=2100421 RepID=A0A6J7WSE0_9CAUD|nr:IbpA Molecular chaperone (small heat shock protein) [uncultured Caudovirales phage]CAB5219748.1 IbpA Molecular chaperone (small heat shock protein) [uncultured Caudovirales phage]